LTALFIFPASLLRPLGGWLSDKFGARRMMYWVFGIMLVALLILSVPNGRLVFDAPGGQINAVQFMTGPALFTGLVFIVGCGMGIGKAAVYKYIPEYFPRDVGAVGGLVGLLGALGGFFLPPLFAYAKVRSGLPQTTFLILFVVTAASFVWLHIVVQGLLRRATPALTHQFEVKTDSVVN